MVAGYNELNPKQKLILKKFELVREIHATKLLLKRLEKRLEKTQEKIKELEENE